MKKVSTTSIASLPTGMGAVGKAWDAVSVSFDRFCLTAGIEALGTMMEKDAEEACGLAMLAAMAGAVIAGAEPRARSASTPARWRLSGPACATSGAENSRFRAGTVRSRRIGWASGR